MTMGKIMTDVHEGVPAWYDVAMTTRHSRALLRDIANRELGGSEMHAHVMTILSLVLCCQRLICGEGTDNTLRDVMTGIICIM